MRFIFSFLLSSFVFFTQANASYVFVGSGGEGYESHGKIFTRDLFDYDLHEAPWFGTERDPILAAQLAKWNPLELSPQELDLLLRKLTDLNSAHNFLGDDLLMVLEYFNWSYTKDPLVLLEPDEIRKPIDKTKRVSIANRFMNSIVINRELFQRLDEKNKIALLLHEAIYSVTSLNYQQNGNAFVSVATARLVTSTLFNESALKIASTEALLRNHLRLSVKSELFRAFTGNYIQVILFDRTGAKSSASRKIFGLTAATSDSRLLIEMCRSFMEDGNRISVVELQLLGKLVRAENYRHETGPQEALRVDVSPAGYHNFRFGTNDPEVCGAIISEAIRRRFALKKD